MKEDSMGDPISDPNASIAKLLIDQVNPNARMVTSFFFFDKVRFN